MSTLKFVVLKEKGMFPRSRYGVRKGGVCERMIRALYILLYTPVGKANARAYVCVVVVALFFHQVFWQRDYSLYVMTSFVVWMSVRLFFIVDW